MKTRKTKYVATLRGKQYYYNGQNTDDVITKLHNRKVFGNPLICNSSLKMYDAATRGKIWAEYDIDGNLCVIEKI